MSGLLLDTNVFLWAANLDARLSVKAGERIQREAGPILVSMASVWEIAIKVGIGKLNIGNSISGLIQEAGSAAGIKLLSIEEADVEGYATLKVPASPHRDPFDRMLVVQASRRNLTLLSSDRIFESYDVDFELA